MVTKTSSSKKKSDGGSAVKQPKFKLPVEYIARPPSNAGNNKELCTVMVNTEVLQALEISSGSMCVVSKVGSNGVLAIAKAGDQQMHPQNVLMMSSTLRSVGNIILGDRVEIRKFPGQPAYATSVTIGPLSQDNADTMKRLVEKLLDDCGIIMPGMIFTSPLGQSYTDDLLVVDVNDGSLPDVGSIDLNNGQKSRYQNSFFLSPPTLFRKGFTKILFTMDNSVDKKYDLPHPLSYQEVGGLAKEIQILENTIKLPLHHPEVFSEFGVSPPRGILLHGPPGTGKTMLLRCVANTSNAHVLTINGPSIVSKYLGETEQQLREIFKEAVLYQPSIIFIDEIDSLAPSRNNDDSGEVESRVVATLLTLMDGMGGSGKVVVVGATNRPNTVDPALRRPGRFDQEVEIGIPDVEGRFDILLKNFNKMSDKRCGLTRDNIQTIAGKTHGYVGADLTALCRESVMKAIQRGGLHDQIDKLDDSLQIGMIDVEEAMIEVRPSAMREIFLEMPKVYWADIGGQEDLKIKMQEMIQLPLEYSKTFTKLGVRAPKGVLLYGPPGCSKTLIGKALATESGINFFAVKGPEIFNKYVGESERAIREVFRKARAASPSIIFFDEIDAIAQSRERDSTQASSNVLTSLLNEIDGVEELNGVIIVGATNKPDEIDSALLRPGRLDRHLYVGPPDLAARTTIIKKCVSKFHVPDVDEVVPKLATLTEGCSGAEVVLLCQEAGLAAIMENKDRAERVEWRHFEKALGSMTKGITSEMLEYYKNFEST